MDSARGPGKGPARGLAPACLLLLVLVPGGLWLGGCSSATQAGMGGTEEMAPPPAAAVAMPASGPAGDGAPTVLAAVPAAPTRYVIRPGDTLQIKFLYHPYFNDTLPVRPDGRISLQLIQDVSAAGLTPGQLRWYLMKKFEKIIDKPEITVTVKAFAQRPGREDKEVYVGGEVLISKKLTFRQNLTVLQAVYEVGGFKDTANLDSIIVIRNVAGPNRSVQTMNLTEVLEGNGTDILLQDTDVVFVPKSFIAQADVYVDQYLNRLVPRWVMTGFTFAYPLTDTQVDSTLDIRVPQQGN